MVAVFAVVLAFAGAPANTPVGCYRSFTPASIAGQTLFYATGDVRIEVLERTACLAAQFAAANRAGRTVLVRDHPHTTMIAVYGRGMLQLLHEAEHVALRTTDECRVETAAWQKLPVLLKMFTPRLWQSALAAARAYHQGLPANYRGC